MAPPWRPLASLQPRAITRKRPTPPETGLYICTIIHQQAANVEGRFGRRVLLCGTVGSREALTAAL